MSPPSQPTNDVCKEEVEQRPTTNPENVIGEGDEPGNLVIFWTVSIVCKLNFALSSPYIVHLKLECAKLPLYKVSVLHFLTPRGR